jgi:hypothetical protein
VFDGHYVDWRETRINKIISIFGKEFFNGKTILELGAGHGHIGNYFRTLGAHVIMTDGKPEHVEKMKESFGNKDIFLLDQETQWNSNEKFDIVIHWGVLYHIDNWKEDLQIAIRYGNIIFLESEVCDSDDPNIEIKVQESDFYDQAVNLTRIGSRPSASMIEQIISKTGSTFIRYDDADINSGFHNYNWAVKNTNQAPNGQRRFWIIKNETNCA